MARAAYIDRQILLMDDPISPCDELTKQRLLKFALLGIMAEKTRVLVTHETRWLKFAQKIIVMKDGNISFQGSFEDCKKEGMLDYL